MAHLILLNKPYGVLCQFSPVAGRPTLKDLVPVPNVYPAGRLDADSEGLVVLTDDGRLQQRIADPGHKLEKGYWVQVEGEPKPQALEALRGGLDLGEFVSRPARIRAIGEPVGLWSRSPPIRLRKTVPTAWLEVILREGRNRQVRRMTARVGMPTLRLIRFRVGAWQVAGLEPGEWREMHPSLPEPGSGA